jgi:hypothetical protein
MATFNLNTSPSPIYPSIWNSGQSPSPNIGSQFFLGCSVIDFTVNGDWSSQGGSLSVNLLEDNLDTSNLDYNDSSGTWTLGSSYQQKLRDVKIWDYATQTSGSLPVIGSPQHFRLVDPTGSIVFQYDGILNSISRNASPNNGKVYSVNLSSPLKLLENCSIILRDTPGFGHEIEGIPSGISMNGFYQQGSGITDYAPRYYDSNSGVYISNTLDENLSSDASGLIAINRLNINEIYSDWSDFAIAKKKEDIGLSFGSHNRSINWKNIYNLQNVFGVFENYTFGLNNYARFGGSRSAGNAIKSEGMRLDMISFALDELINNNVSGDPMPSKRYFGGNIISGTTTYNFYDVSQGNVNSNPYFFGFDVYSFTSVITEKLGSGYVYPGDISSNLLDFVSTLCSEARIDFLVELNRIQTADSNAANYWNGTGVINYDCPGSLYDGGTFPLVQSYEHSVPGGIISIKTLDRRSLSITDSGNINTPFSKVAYQILGYEVPDYGDKNIGYLNPGDPDPSGSSFESGDPINAYLDPLDDDYSFKGTDGSMPYGGQFPVETKLDQNVSAATLQLNNSEIKPTQTQITLQDNQQVTAKYVVGGKQSRITFVPQEYIYQYWGDIKLGANTGCLSYDEYVTQNRAIPVITPFLPSDDMADFILIDMKNLFSEVTSSGYSDNLRSIANQGIYTASISEIRAAMASESLWHEYMNNYRPCKVYALKAAFGVDPSDNLGSEFLLNVVTDSGSLSVTTSSSEGFTKKAIDVKNATNKNIPARQPSKIEFDSLGYRKQSNSEKFTEAFRSIYQKVKQIGDIHYGKTWAVWSPHPSVQLTDEFKNYGEYQYSWLPTDDAYLEPAAFEGFSAPKHTAFLNGARLTNYANYKGVISSGDVLIDRNKDYQMLGSGTLSSGVTNAPDVTVSLFNSGDYKFDFSDVNPEDIVDSQLCGGNKTSLRIQSDHIYSFVPYDYFYWYDRGRIPYVSSWEKTISIINYNDHFCAVQYPGVLIETGYRLYEGTTKANQDDVILTYAQLPSSIDYTVSGIIAQSGKNEALDSLLCGSSVYSSGIGSGIASGIGSGISNSYSIVEDFMKLKVPDHGLNCITFTKVTTPFVKMPVVEPNTEDEFKKHLRSVMLSNAVLGIASTGNAEVSNTGDSQDLIPGQNYQEHQYYVDCVQPLEVGLAQQSTRHCYGPWFTNHNFTYGGKVEFISDESLVPENFIFPVFGSLTSPNAPVFSSQLSGFVGLNYAGQAIANSIDGYGQFASEDGSITIPGAPLIKRIGDALLDGPYITDLSVTVNADGISTRYGFNSVTSRTGKTNTDIVTKLRHISSSITKNRIKHKI